MRRTRDPFRGWDAQRASQETLFTPAMAAEIGPNEPMPAVGRGSYIKTPPWPGTVDPFDVPAPGNEGGSLTMETDDEVDVFDTHEDGNIAPAGEIGDWTSELITQVVAPIGQAFVTAQNARTQARFGITPVNALTPTPSAATPPPAQAPVQRQSFNYKPLVYGALGLAGLIVVASAMRRRR